MMNVKQYIESGILSDYCLGLLDEKEARQVEALCDQYPELMAELSQTREALFNYSAALSKEPAPHLKEEIWKLLENVNREEKMDYQELPVLNKYSDKENWLKAVKPLLPSKLESDIFVKVIRNDEKLEQTLIWTKIDYPDEVHDDLQECFMVLEGECECYVGDKVFRLGPGGFLEIPLHVHHDVKIRSEYVLAVVQRLKVA